MTFYFGILSSFFFFFPIARNVLKVTAKVSVFFTTLLVDWPHHQYYITDINSDSRGSKSNWWVSEKRNAVTLGRAGYIDDELIVYKSITVSQKSSQPGASEHNLGATSHASMFGGKLADEPNLLNSIAMHLSKYWPSKHCIVSASLKHFQLFWFVCRRLFSSFYYFNVS